MDTSLTEGKIKNNSLFSKYKYKKNYIIFIALCYFFYLSIMTLKMTYSVQMVSLIDYFKTTKTQVSFGLTLYYLVYGVSQIALAPFIKKINIEKFLLITCLISAITLSIIGFSTALWQVWAIFAFNGVLHVAVWGGLTVILSKYLPDDIFSFAFKVMATGTPIGKTLNYGVSALFVEYFSWKATFVFFGMIFCLAVILMFLYTKVMKKILIKHDEFCYDFSSKKKAGFIIPNGLKFNVKRLVAGLLIGSVLVNLISYSVSNWIPSLLKDEHSCSASVSLLFTMIVPFSTAFVAIIAYTLSDKVGRLFLLVLPFIAVLILSLVGLFFYYDSTLVFALIVSLIVSLIIQMLGAFFGTYTAGKLKYYSNIGTVSLLINAGACFGAAAAPFITGIILDGENGWANYYLFLIAIAVVTLLVSIVLLIMIRKEKVLTKWFG